MTTVGLIGGGTMGASLAALFLAKGFNVILVTRRKEAVEKLREKVNLFASKMEPQLTAKLTVATETAQLASSDIVIETLEENLAVKRQALAEIEKICRRPNVFFYSNTSSLSITEIASTLTDGSRLAGMHFFNPAHKMQLVEIVKTSKTSPQCIETALATTTQLGKTPVIVTDSPGFVVNRLLMPFLLDAVKLCEAGVASEKDIDTAVKLGLNHPMGPFELLDLIGIDVFLSILQQLKLEPPESVVQMVKEGKLGKKTKRGFYKYE